MRALRSNCGTLGLESPLRTPIGRMLRETIEALFRGPLSEYAHEAAVLVPRAEQVLNQYYVLTNTQSAVHASLLLPLLLVFPDADASGPELLTMFHTLVSNVVPGGAQAGLGNERAQRVAACVLHELKTCDNELYEAVLDKFAAGTGDGEGVMHCGVEAGQPGSQRSAAAHSGVAYRYGYGAAAHAPQSPAELVCSLINTACVGMLSTDAMLFVWDQCFLCTPRALRFDAGGDNNTKADADSDLDVVFGDRRWATSVFANFLVDVLRLLRAELLDARVRVPFDMQQVLQNQARTVLTRDVRAMYSRRRAREESTGAVGGASAHKVTVESMGLGKMALNADLLYSSASDNAKVDVPSDRGLSGAAGQVRVLSEVPDPRQSANGWDTQEWQIGEND